jgi:hypothetical protein
VTKPATLFERFAWSLAPFSPRSRDQGSLTESEGDLDASDDPFRPEPLLAVPGDIAMFTKNLDEVQHEFSSFCVDLDKFGGAPLDHVDCRNIQDGYG